jgi:hypothetical protein
VNTTKSEIDYMKRIFDSKRIQKMNDQEEKVKYLEYEAESLKVKIENCATQDNMEKVKESLKSYAQLNIVQEIRDDM